MPPGSSVHAILQRRILKWFAYPPPKPLPNPGVQPMSPALAGRFFTTEPPGKPYSRPCTEVSWYSKNCSPQSIRSDRTSGVDLKLHSVLLGDSDSKEFTCNVGDLGLTLGSEKSPEEENDYPPVFLPGEFHDRGAWWATLHGVTNCPTQLSD